MSEGNNNNEQQNQMIGPERYKVDDDIDDNIFLLQELPEDPTDNPDIAALQSLIYEGTPDEIAENFKDQGNECYNKGKKYYKNAIHFYTQGLQQEITDNDLKGQLYANRAAVQLQLGNNGHVVSDCLEALKYSSSMKIYYRLVSGLIGAKKYDQAMKYADEGLSKYSSKTLKRLKEKAIIEKSKADERESKKKQLKSEREGKELKTIETIKKKGIVMGEMLFNQMQIYLRELEFTVDDAGYTHWPVLFIYEEYGQMDVISDFREDQTFGQHIEMMFPEEEYPDWDKRQKYKAENLQIFTIVNHTKPIDKKGKRKRARKIRVRQTTPLINVLTHPEYVVPGIPVFYILPNDSVAKLKFITKDIEELGKREF